MDPESFQHYSTWPVTDFEPFTPDWSPINPAAIFDWSGDTWRSFAHTLADIHNLPEVTV